MNFNTLEEVKDRFNVSSISKPALIGIAAIVLVIAFVAGWRLIGATASSQFEVSKASAEEQSEAHNDVNNDAEKNVGKEVGKDAGKVENAVTSLFVHVSGAVVKPGLYELAGAPRVGDAIEAAGGFADDAVNSSVNLARQLQDGEQIIVASQDDVGAQEETPASTSPGAGSDTSAAGGRGAASGLVNINTASAVELTTLPGIGEATAAKIVAYRETNGSFKAIEDIKSVSGVGDKKFDSIASLICV